MRAIGGAHQETVDAQLHVLWVGDALPALDALERFGLPVMHVAADVCAEHVAARAPDMIVLCGSDASQVEALVRELRGRTPGATIPVVTIAPGATRMQTPQRRAGVVARLAAELPPHVLAHEIHERLAQLASRSPQWDVEMPWFELDAWLAMAMRDGSSGFLICGNPAGAIALGSSGSFAPSAQALRTSFAEAETDEPKSLRFLELPASRLLVLTEAQSQHEAQDVSGAQIVVVHVDADQAGELCTALADTGAEAHAVGVDPSELATVPSFAPTLLVLSASALAHGSVSVLWEDARLASVSWLVLDDSPHAALSPGDVVGPACALIASARQLQRRLTDGELVIDRVERFGTAGWLKEVGRCSQPLTLVLQGASGRSEISLAAGRIREATFAPADRGSLQTGRAALQASLAMHFGRVLVGPHDAVLAYEASPPRRPGAVSGAPAKAPEPEVGDFQERPTASRAAIIKPGTHRSFRPSGPEPSRAKPKQLSGTGRLLPLKGTLPPPPPRMSALPALPAAPLPANDAAPPAVTDGPQIEGPAPHTPQPVLVAPVRDEVPTLEFPAALERPAPVVLPARVDAASATVEQVETHAPSMSEPAVPSALTEQIAADIEGELARAELAEEPTEVIDTPHKSRWSLVIGSIAVLGCASAAFVMLQRSPDAALTFEQIAQTLRGTLAPTAATPAPAVEPPAPDVHAAEVATMPPAQKLDEALPAVVPAEPPAAPAPSAPATATSVEEDSPRLPSARAPVAAPAEPAARDGTPPADAPPVLAAAPASDAPPADAPAAETEGELAPSSATERAEDTPFDALVNRAKLAREQGRYVQAEALLNEALRLQPDDFGTRYQLALTLVRLRRFEDAQAELERARQLNPESPLPWLLRGDILLQVGSRREALEAWTKCRELRPALQSCEQRLARWAMRPGNDDEQHSE